MLHTIRTIFEILLCLLLPAHGCHRAAGPRPTARRERRVQRGRRRELWLAVHGIDVGPRRLHGVEVAAR
ncbi:hypothetical protein ACO0M4_17895 [Streptomyces sp. RGM 3693]|uniref:hypothetical protein n=1 Tax=Streptomyces sp. RGM 3693 TaxID=3413284 RepID=UPI003D2A93B8